MRPATDAHRAIVVQAVCFSLVPRLKSHSHHSTDELSVGHRSSLRISLFLNFSHTKSQASSWGVGFEKKRTVPPWILNVLLFQAAMPLPLKRGQSQEKTPSLLSWAFLL